MDIDKILNDNMKKENKLLKKLIKKLLVGHIGDLCFISNKKLELGFSDDFKQFLEALLDPRINELDKDYIKLLDRRGVDFDFYKDLLSKLESPIITINK